MSTALQVDTVLRKADLQSLRTLLQEQADVKYDAVVPASKLRYENGRLHLVGDLASIDEDGVSVTDRVLNPTDVFEDGVSARLGIPRQYLRTLRETGVNVNVDVSHLYPGGNYGDAALDLSLLDANVNGLLQAQGDKRYLVRSFSTDNADLTGIARSLHSNRYALIDHLDIATAAFKGISEAGINPAGLGIDGDISERRFYLRVSAPEIKALAPELLGNYRSPFSGKSGADLPVVFAGLVLTNSETGFGKAKISPRVTFEICGNGATISKDAFDKVHLGAALDEGVIKLTEDTERKYLDLVVAQVRDAVKTFLDVDYVRKVIADISEQAGVKVDDPAATIERVARKHAFTEAEQASIFDCFIKGGDVTAGGVFQAVTAAAQGIADPDRAAEFEDVALDVLATAAAPSL